MLATLIGLFELNITLWILLTVINYNQLYIANIIININYILPIINYKIPSRHVKSCSICATRSLMLAVYKLSHLVSN